LSSRGNNAKNVATAAPGGDAPGEHVYQGRKVSYMFGSDPRRYLQPFARLRDSWSSRRESGPNLEGLRAGLWKNSECAELNDIVSMIKPDERRLLFYLAKDYFSGQGAIVDAGAFLGGSARCFGLGLQQNQRVAAADKLGVIHSFDVFIMRPWWGPEWFTPDPRPEPDDDIFPFFERNLGPLLKHVTVHKGEMADQTWDGGPIEILFLDICKTVKSNDNCSIQFFPNLIPGSSIFIEQDYLEPSPYIWIYATIELLRSHFKMIARCNTGSVAYLCTKQITKRDIENALIRPLSPERRLEITRRASLRWKGADREMLEASMKLNREFVEKALLEN
jgi:hypothetical protein